MLSTTTAWLMGADQFGNPSPVAMNSLMLANVRVEPLPVGAEAKKITPIPAVSFNPILSFYGFRRQLELKFSGSIGIASLCLQRILVEAG